MNHRIKSGQAPLGFGPFYSRFHIPYVSHMAIYIVPLRGTEDNGNNIKAESKEVWNIKYFDSIPALKSVG